MVVKLLLNLLLVFPAAWAQAQESSGSGNTPAADAVTESTSTKDTTYLICKNNNVVRTIRVNKKDNGGCETTYTKDGVDQSVGSSWAVSRCSKVLGNIRTNLEKANWKCKDISEARVSSSEE